MDSFSDQYHMISEHPGGSIKYISDMLVKDNTRDPLTGKYMLQTFEQYNVGVLFVRFIQLYALSHQNPSEYKCVLKVSTAYSPSKS